MLHGIGKPVRRKEDFRFLTGRAQYVADIELPGQLHLVVFRAPVAHATINAIDTVAAKAAEGVHAVFTAEDLIAGGVKTIRCAWPYNNKDGSPMVEPDHYCLAHRKMVHFGEPVAAVVAESKNLAADAAELIEIDYTDHPAVIGAGDAVKPGAPLVWDDAPGNLVCDWEIGDRDATDAVFKRAAHVVSMDTVQNRLVPNSIEARAVNAHYDAGSDDYTLYLSSQNPHLTRMVSCRNTLDISEHKLRIIAPDVGGGFGMKSPPYAEDYLCLFAAKLMGRPVKWVSDRAEAFVSDSQARDHVTHAEMALDEHGKILAVRDSHVADLGAYVLPFATVVPTILYSTMLPSIYTVEAFYSDVKLAFTNTVPVDAYRGAGRPEAAYTVERLVDLAAEKLGIDPVELRKRNFIPTDAFPYETVAGIIYDQSDYHQCLDMALQASDFEGFEARREAAQARGKLRGIGISTYTEHTGNGPSAMQVNAGSLMAFYESTTIRVNPDATVSVLSGAHSHGQGHETSFAQVVAEKLNVPFEDVDIVHGDTAKIPHAVGTFASRSMVTGGGAICIGIDKIVAKGKIISAHVLEATPEEIDYIDGFFKVKDSDRLLSFKDVVHLAYLPGNYPIDVLEPGLEETTFYDPPAFTFPAGAHVVEVEIDPETGDVDIITYSVGDDFGVIINPMIVDGQTHGGVAQGVGQALMEDTIYDKDSGQLISGTFLDYCMPRADDLPMITVEAIDNATDRNPLGCKGAGEAGTIGALAAVMNAVLDALRPVGVKDLTMPATSQKIWAAIENARSSA